MARADTVTKLTLDEWARILGINPLHFNSVELSGLEDNYSCAATWLQHSWQTADAISREELALTIRQAEDDIEGLLGFRLSPDWEVDEWRPTIRPYRPELVNLSVTDIRGYGQVAKANWGHFISGGVKKKDPIIAAHAIIWSDADSDGYKETGTVDHATSVTDPCEIAIYYPGKVGADEWEIRPISVSIAAGIATITFRRELCVLENLLESMSAKAVDGSNDANFLATVDVYRRYNDPQTQVSFLWESLGCEACNGSGCAVCSYAAQTGCLMARGDPKLSMVVYKPADWNSETLDFDATAWAVGRQPDIVRLYYLAGLRDKGLACSAREMSMQWKQIVAYYAASLLDRPVCDCSNVAGKIDLWRQDLAFSGGATELATHNLSPEDLDNPLGTTRGAIHAWKRIRQVALGEAVYA